MSGEVAGKAVVADLVAEREGGEAVALQPGWAVGREDEVVVRQFGLAVGREDEREVAQSVLEGWALEAAVSGASVQAAEWGHYDPV